MDETERARWIQARAAFLATKLRNGSRHTYSAYASVLDRLFGKDFPRSPAEVTTAEIETFVNDLAVSTGNRRNRLSILRQFYVYTQRTSDLLPADFIPPTRAAAYLDLAPGKKRYKPWPEKLASFAHLPAPWQMAIRDFLTECSARSGSEKSAEQRYYLLAQFFSDKPDPATISKMQVLAYIQSPVRSGAKAGRQVSPNTRNSRLSAVRALYQWSSDYEIDGQVLYTRAMPTRGLRAVKAPRVYRYLSESELERLFSAIDRSTLAGKRDFALFSLYLTSCRRLQEIAVLRVRDLERTTIIDSTGAAREILCFHFRGKGRSQIDDSQEMSPTVWQHLRAYWAADGRSIETMQPETPLFVAANGNGRGLRPLSAARIDTIFKGYLVKAGLETRGRAVHSLRHSSARIRLAQGASLSDVQKVLRHQNVATTQIYIETLLTADDPGQALIEARLSFLK